MKPPTNDVNRSGTRPGMPGQGASKAEAGKTELGKTEPGKAELGRTDTGRSDALRNEAVKSDALKDAVTAETAAGDLSTPGKTLGTPLGGTSKVEAMKPGAKPDASRVEAGATVTPKPGTSDPKLSTTEAAKDVNKSDPAKPDAMKSGAFAGPQATPRSSDAPADGPIIDLKAKRLPDSAEPIRAGATASSDKPAAASPPSGSGKPASASGPTPRITPAAPDKKARGLGFGSVATAGLLGGVVGAGLLFAVERSGALGNRGEDPRLSALDQRIGALASRDALAALDQRIAANESAVKPLPEAVRGAETIAREALQKVGAVPAPATEPGAEAAAPAAPVAPAIPLDLIARIDNLDQRLAALQEEPGREPPADARTVAAPPKTDDTAPAPLASIYERLTAVEGKVDAGTKPAQPELGDRLAALQSDVESRTKANAEADRTLGEKLAALQQALDTRIQAATDAVQSATQASKQAADAGRSQAEEVAKTVERQLQTQAEKIAGLDKAVAERAETATVQSALRVVSADRIATALTTGAPYADALATLRGMEPGDPARLTAVAVFADKGAPTTRGLAAEFKPIAERINAARKAAEARSVVESGDLSRRFMSMAESIVQVRKVDTPVATGAGTSVDPTVKVQDALDRGAIGEAAQAFADLPEELRMQAGDFGTKLRSRAAAAEAAQGLLSEAFKGLPAPGASR